MYPVPSATIAPLTEKPTLDTVRNAIASVLSPDQSINRKAATDFLDSLKNSVFAWEICNQLLQPTESLEACYIAANILRQKIAKNFNELPTECYSSLKDSILHQLQAIDDYAVQGQLTMAIADLTLLIQSWQNPIEDLAKQLGLDIGLMSLTNTSIESILKALQNRLIFAYIMHQMCDLNHSHSDRPCKIGARRREEYEDYLMSKCNQVITWWLHTLKELDDLDKHLKSQYQAIKNEQEVALEMKCSDTTSKLTGQIYLCYSAWLRIFDEENVSNSLPLIDASFRHLADLNCNDTVHRYAVEVVVATAFFCEDNTAVDYLVDHLVTQVFTLEGAYLESTGNYGSDYAINLTKVFTCVAEIACFRHVIEGKDFRLIELLLKCLSRQYDTELVEETYSFWRTFIETLQNKLKADQYGPFIDYIHKFIVAVIHLCEFEPDETEVVSKDQDIHRFRSNTAELVMSVLYITSVDKLITDERLLDSLAVNLKDIRWEALETRLFLLSKLSQMLTRDGNATKGRIFTSMMEQQTEYTPNRYIHRIGIDKQPCIKIGTASEHVHPQVVATTLTIISSMGSFLVESPENFILAINYILTAMIDEKYQAQLILPAASALCSIMESQGASHLSSCSDLILVVKNICTKLDLFDDLAANELLVCSAMMLDGIEDTTTKDQLLTEILRPTINSLQETLKPPKRDETEPSKYLDRLSSFFRQSSTQTSLLPSSAHKMTNLITLIDGELWPIIVKVLEVYASERGLAIERACRTIRYLLRCLKPEWMIQRVAETMISLYKTYPQNSSPLYICSILVDEFANRSPEINQGLFTMLDIFCTLTFTLLKMDSPQSKSLLTMKSYPETIDDMMRLFNRFLRKCPDDFVNCKALESIIELSISSLRIDHQDANANVSKFVSAFIALAHDPKYARIADAIKNVLGGRITDAVIRACLFDIPSRLINEEVSILQALYSFDKHLLAQWIAASVAGLPTANIQGIESVSKEQLEDFKHTLSTAGTAKRMVNCLRAYSRLYS